MMNEAKQYTIRILDDEYSIVSDESADQVFEVAQLVDNLAQEIACKAPNADYKKILTLVALRFARDWYSAQKHLDFSSAMHSTLIESINRELTHVPSDT